jgi:hypothetical protein
LARLSGSHDPNVIAFAVRVETAPMETGFRVGTAIAIEGDMTRNEEKALTMTDGELCFAIRDCREAAEAMDEIDRVQGGDRAGQYRDEASAYRAELARRVRS